MLGIWNAEPFFLFWCVFNKYFGLYRFPFRENCINPYFCLGKMNKIYIMIVKTLNFAVKIGGSFDTLEGSGLRDVSLRRWFLEVLKECR